MAKPPDPPESVGEVVLARATRGECRPRELLCSVGVAESSMDSWVRIAASLFLDGLPKLTFVFGECRFETGICVGIVLEVDIGGTGTGWVEREVAPEATTAVEMAAL